MKSEYEEGEPAQRVEEFVQCTEEVFLNDLHKNLKRKIITTPKEGLLP